MSHRIEMIASILAVLKSGAAYVPAEPSLPQTRIDYMMQTAGVKFIITDNYCRDIPQTKLLMDRSVANGVAYVLYTSGTSLSGLMDFCERHNVTIISGFPYLLADMNRYRCCPAKLRLLTNQWW